MTIDLSRFRQVFLEESREGLDAIEQGLLRLEQGTADGETIHTVFRAAHSIKGGAGTFGLAEVAGVTHLLETLLDQVRSGRRAITAEVMAVLLRSVDVLRNVLDAAQHGAPADEARVAELMQALQGMLDVAPGASPAAAAVRAAAPRRPRRWSVNFVPAPALMASGNDPLRILEAVAALGRVDVRCDASRLPPFAELAPSSLYLAWHLDVRTAATREELAEAFAWVEDDCELSIEDLGPAPEATTLTVPAAAAAAPAAGPAERSEDRTGSIRVSIEKVDAMINLVGELVITQAMLKQWSGVLDPAVHERLLSGLAQLDRNTRDLQDAVMSVRMQPVDVVFSRFPRMVRDLAGKLGKHVQLRTEGEATELDKGVIEKIVDPLSHLVRNALDHGFEAPAERLKAGKDECGTLSLSAWHRAGHIVIEVRDDGRGLSRERILASAAARGLPVAEAMTDAEVWQLIFAPGLSTAEAVTDVSGRGVGMDVVRKNILSLGGQVDVDSRAGAGTTVTIRLPLTLAILDGMSVAVGDEIFIVPLNSVVESLQPAADDLKSITGQGRLLRVRGEYIPLFSLRELFGVRGEAPPEAACTVVLLEAEGRKTAIWVDELVGQQQVVIKSLDANYRRIAGVSGATIMGDGRVALIIDVSGLSRVANLAQAA